MSVDEGGRLTCWTTLDNYGANRQFEADMGMAPDAKLKLMRVSTTRCLFGSPTARVSRWDFYEKMLYSQKISLVIIEPQSKRFAVLK